MFLVLSGTMFNDPEPSITNNFRRFLDLFLCFQRLKLLWNNYFWKTFNCSWRERVYPLMFYCCLCHVTQLIKNYFILGKNC